jgi:hypothetical protein
VNGYGWLILLFIRGAIVPRTSPTELFRNLNAPLANSRWSWGAVRDADGAVFLRVWQDETIKHGDSWYVKIFFEPKRQVTAEKPGFQERQEHVELIRKGAPCYLIMCQAKDPNDRPRAIKDLIDDEVFQGGKLLQRNGDWYMELLKRVPVAEVSRARRQK